MSRTSQIIQSLLQAGLTQVEIAKRTGIPQCRVSRWVLGGAPRAADDVLKLRDLAAELQAAADSAAPFSATPGAQGAAHG